MTIGERFRELRLHLKLTQDQIGEMCGDATKGLISQWENDLLIPPSDRLIALSDKTAFSIDWLLNGRGEMFEPHLSDAAKHIVNKLSTMTEKEQYRIARMVTPLPMTPPTIRTVTTESTSAANDIWLADVIVLPIQYRLDFLE